MKYTGSGKWVIILGIALILAPPALSDDDDSYYPPAYGKLKVIPLDQILSQLKAQISGEVISIEREFEHGRLTYEIKLIDKHGYVREIYVDAVTGKIIAEELDDD